MYLPIRADAVCIHRFFFAFVVGTLCAFAPITDCGANKAQAATAQNTPGPSRARPFALTDAEGRQRSLANFKGRNCVVYFLCGCERCQRCARAWGEIQQNGALPLDASRKLPHTLIVFAGDVRETRTFAAANGLDTKQTVLLPDPELRVTQDYKAVECPRAFVVDSDGFIRYTNNHPDDAPLHAPALAIVSNVIGALRAAASAPASLAPLAPLKAEPLNPFALTVLEGKGVESIKPSQGRYTFGNLDVFTNHTVEHTFIVRNDTQKPIVLSRLGSSCGCTSAFLGISSSNEASPANSKT